MIYTNEKSLIFGFLVDYHNIKGRRRKMVLKKDGSLRLLIVFFISVVVLFICKSLNLEQFGPNTGLGLGYLIAVLVFIIFSGAPIVVAALLMGLGGAAVGIWSFGDLCSSIGSPGFVSTIGMLLVAMGCEATPFGKRIAYIFLKLFGDDPFKIVCVFAVTTGLISAFVSNVATLIMMSSIAAALLEAMGEKPGKSNLGRTIMVLIPVFSYLGGMALISGSPNGNNMALTYLANATSEAYIPSYRQWAVMAFPSFLVISIPTALIYIKCCHLKKTDITIIPKSYYEEKLAELGKISSAEIRWIILVAGMVGFMIYGINMALVALVCGVLAIFPFTGIMKAENAFKKLPWDITIAMCMLGMLGSIFTSTGLGNLIASVLNPLTGNMGPLALSIVSCLLTGLLVNIFINSNLAGAAITIGTFGPICVSMGYNPAVIMAPTLFATSFFFVLGMNGPLLLNKAYGYWDITDPTLPGTLTILFTSIVIPVLTYLLALIAGIPIYL